MSEFDPEAIHQPEEVWNVHQKNITREALYETGYGKPLAERNDADLGPDNWKWKADTPSPIEQAELVIASSESKLAREALRNKIAGGEFVANDGVSAAGLENRSAAPVFGTVYVKEKHVTQQGE